LSVKRRSSVAMIDPENSDKIKIFVKGAPEYLLNMCKNYQTGEGSSPLDTQTKNMYE
jgi:magnesium-transporting ATPase (P-type)